MLIKSTVVCLLCLLTSAATIRAQTTTRKVLLEKYTGAWCQWCPDGAMMSDEVKNVFGASAIIVANHSGDALQIPEGYALQSPLGIMGYPSATIDRYLFPNHTFLPLDRIFWLPFTGQRKVMPAIASVSFANYGIAAGGSYEMDVRVVFNTAPATTMPLRVNVYVLEDSIAATGTLEQTNGSGAIQGGASPLTNWFHNNTLRAALGGTWGLNPFPQFPAAPVVGTAYTQHFSFTKPAAWLAKNIRLVAFVTYDGTTIGERQVLNSEEMALKSFSTTSVGDAAAHTAIASVSPNPAKADDLVKLEFSTSVNADIRLDVFNSIGQWVARPYRSHDAAGTHTIHVRTADYNLSPGLYFLRLTGSDGSSVMQRLVVR